MFKIFRLQMKTEATLTRPWAPGRPEQEWHTNSPSLRAVFIATQNPWLEINSLG